MAIFVENVAPATYLSAEGANFNARQPDKTFIRPLFSKLLHLLPNLGCPKEFLYILLSQDFDMNGKYDRLTRTALPIAIHR